MLNGTLTLHGIHDVEAFTAQLLPHGLAHDDREDLHAHLIAACWELSLTHNPGRATFSTYAGHTLRRAVVDWQRQRNGRTTWRFATHTHTRTLPQILSTDEHPAALEQTPRDPPTDRTTLDDRLLRTRGSDEAWRPSTRRPRMPRRAP